VGPSPEPEPIVIDEPEPIKPPVDECIKVVSGFQKMIPTVLVLVDRSGSMDKPFEAGLDRWTTVRRILTDPTSGLLKSLQDDVQFGLALYTSVNPVGGPSTVFESGCPLMVEEPIALNNFDAIATKYGATELIPKRPGEQGNFTHVGGTPTSESVLKVTETLKAFASTGPKAIILATDGDPDNCMDAAANDGNPAGEAMSKQMSVDAVKAAFTAGIKTYVIGVGDEASQAHLKDLAVSGQGGDATAQPYSGMTASQLEAAFKEVIGAERSCTFPLMVDIPIPAFHIKTGNVQLGAQTLTYEDPNGWTLTQDAVTKMQSVVLQGSACEAAKSSNDDVNISFPCVLKSLIPL
jgi:hypothetical protein